MKLGLKFRVLAALIVVAVGFVIMVTTYRTDDYSSSHAKKPAKIAVVNVDSYQDHVTLSWEQLKNDIKSYQIYMRTEKGTWEEVQNVNKKTATCSFPLQYGDTYYFRVRGVNKEKFTGKNGDTWKTAYGKFSDTVQIALTEPKKPKEPEITKTISNGGETNKIKWTKSKSNVGEEVYYKVEYSTLADESGSMTETTTKEIITTDTSAEVPVLAAAKQEVKVTAFYDYEGETYASDTSTLNMDFLYYLYNMERQYKANNFHYNGGASLGSYEHSLATSRLTNCAQFVSWAMQDYGLLPHGVCIWLSTGINGKGAGYIKNSDKVTISYPHASTASLDLQPGDICGYAWHGGVHTMVYVGKDSSGQRLWYSAGPGDVADPYVGPRHKNSYNGKTVHVLIRPKN